MGKLQILSFCKSSFLCRNSIFQIYICLDLYRKNEDESDAPLPLTPNIESNLIAANAISLKLTEVSKIAESLDVALRETQTILELDGARTNSLERKTTDGNTSIDSRGSIDVS